MSAEGLTKYKLSQFNRTYAMPSLKMVWCMSQHYTFILDWFVTVCHFNTGIKNKQNALQEYRCNNMCHTTKLANWAQHPNTLAQIKTKQLAHVAAWQRQLWNTISKSCMLIRSCKQERTTLLWSKHKPWKLPYMVQKVQPNPEEGSQAVVSEAKAEERYMQWMIVHKWQSDLLNSSAWPKGNLACMATGNFFTNWQVPAAWAQKSPVKKKVVHFLKTNQLTANSKLNGGCSKEMAAQSGYWETHWGCLIWHH